MPAPPAGLSLDPRVFFDEAHYLDTYPDVRDANVTAWDHYEEWGRHEGRSPAGWFDSEWYDSFYLSGENVNWPLISPEYGHFEFFCRFGNLLGHSPNPNEYLKAEKEALTLFDAAYYLANNGDVAAAGMDPWHHFCSNGWKERRDPSSRFRTAYYLDTHLEYDANPLFHFINIGLNQGLSTTGPLDVSYTSPRPGVGSTKQISDLVDFVLTKRQSPSNLSDVARLLYASPLFDETHYSSQSGLSASRSELVEHFLTIGNQAGYEVSPDFDSRFYLETYATNVPSLREAIPVVHFLLEGRNLGLYPSQAKASSDIARVREAGIFDPELYNDQLDAGDISPGAYSLLSHFVLFGHVIGAQGSRSVDTTFINNLYRPIIEADMFSPLAFYVRNRNLPWMYSNLDQLVASEEQISAAKLFDPDFYRRKAGLDGFAGSLAMHYATVGTMELIAPSKGFDTESYLYLNPDLARAPINPLLHFELYGQKEGRAGVGSMHHVESEDYLPYDPDLETVVIFCHEGSRTGAPIVGLNIAIALSDQANVVVFIADKVDVLLPDFCRASIKVIIGSGTPSALRAEIDKILQDYGCSYAIVNSVCCHPVMSALEDREIPTVSLIHEFADYVLPSGTLTRMVFQSDVAVFPAKLVQSSYLKEVSKFELQPAETVVAPQGRNALPPPRNNRDTPSQDPLADIFKEIGVKVPTSSRLKVMLGIGSVEPRKGLDLFFQTASLLARRNDWDWRFVWIGGGYDPSRDFNTSLFIDQLIRETGLSESAFVLSPRADLDPFWQLADVFFLSSRLDPYPNVALDALHAKTPLVCFSGASGIADLANDFPFAISSVDFADVQAAADSITQTVAHSESLRSSFSGPEGVQLQNKISFENYVDAIAGLAKTAKKKRSAVNAIKREIERFQWRDLEPIQSQIPSTFGGGFMPTRRSACASLARHVVNNMLPDPFTFNGRIFRTGDKAKQT